MKKTKGNVPSKKDKTAASKLNKVRGKGKPKQH
jgi:hypothetical protein